jgi:hypothetical protein
MMKRQNKKRTQSLAYVESGMYHCTYLQTLKRQTPTLRYQSVGLSGASCYCTHPSIYAGGPIGVGRGPATQRLTSVVYQDTQEDLQKPGKPPVGLGGAPPGKPPVGKGGAALGKPPVGKGTPDGKPGKPPVGNGGTPLGKPPVGKDGRPEGKPGTPIVGNGGMPTGPEGVGS